MMRMRTRALKPPLMLPGLVLVPVPVPVLVPLPVPVLASVPVHVDELAQV